MGIMPLFISTRDRLANNLELYVDSIAPTKIPSGGGFSVQQYTLAGLYEQFTKGRAWWTQSTVNFPLIRYLGCSLTLYRSEHVDYIFNYRNCYPMKASMETYQSCQPTILQLTQNHKIIRCKQHNYSKKPYKKLRIHPPSQFTNKWLFQKDIANIPLLMTQCCATSLDRWFASSTAESTTIGFTCLNPETFKFHNFEQPPTTGYIVNENTYIFALKNGSNNWWEEKIGDIIYLGQSKEFQPGITARQISTGSSFTEKWTTYISDSTYWGNIFMAKYLQMEVRLVTSNHSPAALKDKYKQLDEAIGKENFTLRTIPNLIDCRYNPLADRGDQNEVFLTSILRDNTPIQIPTDPNLKTENLPLWLALMGFVDFQKRQNIATKVDTNYMVVLHTKYMFPKNLPYVIPIDTDFLNETSEYQPLHEMKEYDAQHWHPKTVFQLKSLNEMVACGPGIAKLRPNQSVEAHALYKFYFKIGGCTKPIKEIKNPEDQNKFPTPNNILRSTSLQNPETPVENYLYNFDWRRDTITETALQRIQEYCLSEKTFSQPTGLQVLGTETDSQTETETEEEKEKETLQQLIQQQYQQQREFKRRILRLLTQLE